MDADGNTIDKVQLLQGSTKFRDQVFILRLLLRQHEQRTCKEEHGETFRL